MRKKITSQASTETTQLPKRQAILDLLQKVGRPLKRRQFAEQFMIQQPALRQEFGRLLKAMEKDGQLIRNRNGRYGLIEKMDLLKGRIQAHPDGYGFVIPDDQEQDLFLSSKEMRSVLNGDRVLARQISTDARGKSAGTIVEILERKNHQIVGRYYQDQGIAYVVPDNKRLNQDLLIQPNDHSGQIPKHGQYVVAKIIRQPERRRPALGKVVTIIGDDDEPNIATDIALRCYDLPFEWQEPTLQQVKEICPTVELGEDARQVDVRALPFVTIDGDDARDFDDAVFCEKQDKGWRLLVAIADVSHYVKPQTALDQEAALRGTSVYFPNRVIPMLPERLSNELCSLQAHVDRYSLICELSITADGEVQHSHFFRGIIRSAARLTYTQMEDIVVHQTKQARQNHQALLPHLDQLYSLYQALYKARKNNGLIDFSAFESRFEFDSQGHIAAIDMLERNHAHRLIEEMMLVANVAAGQFLEQNTMPTLYRIHATPKPEKLEAIRSLLSQLGLSLGGADQPTAKDYANLLDVIRQRDDAVMLETILLRSMPLAAYDPINAQHFGLGFLTYAHFTSPIRRYPDLLVHRGIVHLIEGRSAADFAYTAQAMNTLAQDCSMTERRAEEAARDVVGRLKCIFMQGKVGESFSGIVNSVTAFGLFVLLHDNGVEGLIHISHLPADYYHFDPITHSLRGERGGLVYRLGQLVTITVAGVDVHGRKMDFELQTT